MADEVRDRSARSAFASLPENLLPALLAVYFLVFLLLDRLSGWHVSSMHPLLAGGILAWLSFRQRPRAATLFFAVLLVAIAWMWMRDVPAGAGWKAGERLAKAALLLLGLLACSRLPLPAWKASVGAAVVGGLLLMLAYLGAGQIRQALTDPFAFAVTGFVTEMNRNALAVPLGLLGCWAVAAALLLRPVGAWMLPMALLILLMLANGSRNAIASLLLAGMVMLALHSPRQLLAIAGAVIVAALAVYLIWPDFWVHGTFLSNRDVIWAEVLRHLPEHFWAGASSTYFSRMVAPELPYQFAFAHNVYLDYLLAYGLVGTVLLLASGGMLSRLLADGQALPLAPQSIWLCGTGVYLLGFAFFDREHLDPLMLLGLLMIPTLLLLGWQRQGFLGASGLRG